MCLGPSFTQVAVSQASSVTYGCSGEQASAVTLVPVFFDPSVFVTCDEAFAAQLQEASVAEAGDKFVPHCDIDDQLLGKTKLCKYFFRGLCSRGKLCTFAHGRKELRAQPNLFKTELCFEFSNSSTCQRGKACHYAHGERELRAVTMPAASTPKRKGAEPKTCKATQLTQKIKEKECEAEQLRAQLRTLVVEAAKSTSLGPACGFPSSSGSTSRKDGSRISSLPSAAHSWVSEAGSDYEWDNIDQASHVTESSEPEDVVDCELAVRGTFFALVPVAPAARSRARSVPARLAYFTYVQ